MTERVHSCPYCEKSFTRGENLERHRRSQHNTAERRRPFKCDRCGASFSRSDVCKRHIDRCSRGLHSRKRRPAIIEPSSIQHAVHEEEVRHNEDDPSDQESRGEEVEHENLLGHHGETVTIDQDAHGLQIIQSDHEIQANQDDSSNQHNQVMNFDQDLTSNVGSAAAFSDPGPPQSLSGSFTALREFEGDMFGILTDPSFLQSLSAPLPDMPLTLQNISDNASLTSKADTDILNRHGVSHHTSTSYASAYFLHFQPFLPIVHRPTFSITRCHSPLASAIVAIGSMYSPQTTNPKTRRGLGYALWATGVKELRSHVYNKPSMLCERWVLQAWLLHIVFGYYFGDSKSFDTSANMLQKLVTNLRSRCVLNQDLTLNADGLWTARLHQAANWSQQDLAHAWSTFISQETFRLCIHALFFIDIQISSVCNSRPLLWATESTWDLPSAENIWESPSAEEWLNLVQEAIHVGALTIASADAQNRLTMAQVTQSLLGGKPSARLLKQMLACPFATGCIIANIDALVRDFSTSYYRLPPVLPDPSAYHVLSPTQNRCINAAITVILSLSEKDDFACPQLRRLVQMSSWAARIALCEPDVMMVAGVVDTTLAAGLATSAHLILGSGVATRRAAVSTKRRFGEGLSLTMWDDLLKALTVILKSSEDDSVHGPPWMTTLAYRLLLLLWKTLRGATHELGGIDSVIGASAEALSPAKIIVHLIREKIESLLPAGQDADMEDPMNVEIYLFSLMSSIFGRKKTPVNYTIQDILSEAEGFLMTA